MDEFIELKHKARNLAPLTEPEFMTYKAAAKYLGRSYTAVAMLVHKGKLKAHKNGVYRYIRTSDLKAFMSGNPKQQ